MWELDHEEGWALKNWCFRTVVLKNYGAGEDFETMVLESPLNSKEVKSVNPKGNQPWIFIGRYETEAAAPIFWPTDMKSQLIGKDLDAGKYWGQEEKRVAEGEMAGQDHGLNRLDFGQTLGDG